MAIALTGIVGDLSNLVPSGNDLLQQVILGAGASVVLAGLKSNSGQDAVDPLHFFHKPATDNAPATTSVAVGKSITAAAFNSLAPAVQAQVLGAGYIIAG